MPTYRYEAMASTGEEVVDVIEADDPKSARKLLAARGLFVTKLSKSAADLPDGSASETSAEESRESTKLRRQPRQRTGSVLLPCLLVGLAGITSGVYGVVELSASLHLLITGEKADGIVTKLAPYKDSSSNQVRNFEVSHSGNEACFILNRMAYQAIPAVRVRPRPYPNSGRFRREL